MASIAGRKNRNVQAAAISNTVDNQERFFRNKQRIHEYKQSIKQAEIERDNQKLLKKLVEISAGKKSHINPVVSGVMLSKSHSVAQIEFRAKSLHFN